VADAAGPAGRLPALGVLGAGVPDRSAVIPAATAARSRDVSADADPATAYVIYWTRLRERARPDEGAGSQSAAPAPRHRCGRPAGSRLPTASPPGRPSARIGYAVSGPYTGRPVRRNAGDFNEFRRRQQRLHSNQLAGGAGRYRLRRGQRPGAHPMPPPRRHPLVPTGFRSPTPGPQHSAAQAPVTLRLRTGERRWQAPVHFKAHAVAAGLSLAQPRAGSPARPRRPGTYSRHRDAEDAQNADRGRGLHVVDSGQRPGFSALRSPPGPASSGAGLHRGGRPGGAGAESVPGHGPRRSAARLRPRVKAAVSGAADLHFSARAVQWRIANRSCRGAPPGPIGRWLPRDPGGPGPAGTQRARARVRVLDVGPRDQPACGPGSAQRLGRVSPHRQGSRVPMSILSGSCRAEIPSAIKRCWALVRHRARSPEWQRTLERVEVLERRRAGAARLICDTVSDAKLTKSSAASGCLRRPPRRLAWDTGAGQTAGIDGGSSLLEPLGPELTRGPYLRWRWSPGSDRVAGRPLSA